MRVFVAIALLLGSAHAFKVVEVKDACGYTHFEDPSTPETPKEKAERGKWMGTVRYSRIAFEGSRQSPGILNEIRKELRNPRYFGIESRAEILELAIDSFQQRGYFQVQIKPEFKIISGSKCFHNASARFYVEQGHRFQLGTISFKNVKAAYSADELRTMFPLKDGELFNTSQVRVGLEQLRKAYAKLGYVEFTAVPDTKIHEDEKLVDLNIDLDQGKVFHVRQIGVAGLTDERFQKFYALFPLKEGAVYDPESLERFFEDHREFAPKGFRPEYDLGVKLDQENSMIDLRIDLSGYHITWPDVN